MVKEDKLVAGVITFFSGVADEFATRISKCLEDLFIIKVKLLLLNITDTYIDKYLDDLNAIVINLSNFNVTRNHLAVFNKYLAKLNIIDEYLSYSKNTY